MVKEKNKRAVPPHKTKTYARKNSRKLQPISVAITPLKRAYIYLLYAIATQPNSNLFLLFFANATHPNSGIYCKKNIYFLIYLCTSFQSSKCKACGSKVASLIIVGESSIPQTPLDAHFL
jgi:hypothetical protein